MRIFITGANGFLGSALARKWVSEGYQVHALVRPGASLQRLHEISGKITTHLYTDVHSLQHAVKTSEPHVIVHTACAYGRRGESAGELWRANFLLGVDLLDAVLALAEKSITFINAGTILDDDVSDYALTKNQFSSWGKKFALRHHQKLSFINLRLQHMYGPGDDGSKFTTMIFHACKKGPTQIPLTHGRQLRDFIYIDDAVDAIHKVVESKDELQPSETIDVGSGRVVSIREFVELVREVMGTSAELNFGALPSRPGESMLAVADTTRLTSLGWQPRFDLVSGIKKVIELEFVV